MSIFSRLRAVATPAAANLMKRKTEQQVVRLSHDRVMEIKPSSYDWKLFFNDVHFYLMLTGLPLLAVIAYVNITIGPATLSDIPEGYEPKRHEYCKNPITRFLAQYLYPLPQGIYERNLHGLQQKCNQMEYTRLLKKAKMLIRDRNDYRHWYYVPTDNELVTRNIIRDYERQENLTDQEY